MERYDKRKIKIPKSLYYQIENDVVNLYVELQLKVPIDPSDIAKRLGYIVRKMSEMKDKNAQEFLRFDSEGLRRDGYSLYDPSISTFVIWINDVDSLYYEHDDFTIMHEIGHIRLGHKEESDLANIIANCYAGYAFVPSPLYSMFGCKSKHDIIGKFGVSAQCADICYQRCVNWENYFGVSKPYERRLLRYYSAV
jgi:hypothetical protein